MHDLNSSGAARLKGYTSTFFVTFVCSVDANDNGCPPPAWKPQRREPTAGGFHEAVRRARALLGSNASASARPASRSASKRALSLTMLAAYTATLAAMPA
jgi:hypothetical protein